MLYLLPLMSIQGASSLRSISQEWKVLHFEVLHSHLDRVMSFSSLLFALFTFKGRRHSDYLSKYSSLYYVRRKMKNRLGEKQIGLETVLWQDILLVRVQNVQGPRIQQSFSPQSWMSQVVFSICQNLKEVGCNVSDGMNLSKRVRSSGQRARESFFHVLYIGCRQKAWSGFKVHYTSKNADFGQIILLK